MKLVLLGYILLGMLYLVSTYLLIIVRNDNVKINHSRNISNNFI